MKTHWSFAAILILSACDQLPTAENHAMSAVKMSLIDPGSAQFSNVKAGTKEGDFCGLVNAKNRMGGYGGSTPFLYEKGTESVTLFTKYPSRADFIEYLDLTIRRSEAANEKYGEITRGCEFPAKWINVCGNRLTQSNEADDNNLCVEWSDGSAATRVQMLYRVRDEG